MWTSYPLAAAPCTGAVSSVYSSEYDKRNVQNMEKGTMEGEAR
jgi:hypothetical protein